MCVHLHILQSGHQRGMFFKDNLAGVKAIFQQWRELVREVQRNTYVILWVLDENLVCGSQVRTCVHMSRVSSSSFIPLTRYSGS